MKAPIMALYLLLFGLLVFRPKREDIKETWRTFCGRQLYDLCSATKYYSGDQIKE
jgi:hypothetical protein